MSPTGQKQKSVGDPVDRRVSRTCRTIDEAFLALLQRRGYEAVSVSEIAREADVGRATFYEHYKSKDDLLRAQLRRISSSMLRTRRGELALLDASPLFHHVRAAPLLYRIVAGRSAGMRSLRVLQEVLEERAESILLERLSAGAALRGPLTPTIAARVLVANLCALLSWWAEQGMAQTADEMQHLFQVCVNPMLASPGAI